ncbi:dipeptidyl aminopeptidase/acylaminoacyl peptidase [Flavobacterium nitrogenifigens]|uniref:Dipeptidyl aminopeptidase/acylaminoacyl peptidase n=2 Tax=Flavobacterium TaxID=237 RepID=A0A7W7N962_9FLAO|nr:prolyl oligopeptidase family serine peptidase [Flavobacterium nitrogenifigens]MBB4804558.1 dipeptidyl aminopeptidase/acylaminoacyl peptidase [Flavobacterium nitrogenifigens]MBB6389517.1 dipeptidyl aminopeptidase/acylaminoacyl peptidase [Flavobacterium notoginsengisoli]
MGHSFGGYETAFAITQTPLFAAAIAGGAITDLNSFYHTINSSSGRSEMWRFGTEQWSMRKTPYEAPDSYLSNSPLTHVKQLQTPLLLWAGKNDWQVDTHQSLEFYLALRRLGKKGIMLLYPNEMHSLSNPVNQTDLTDRILQWFDFFLKGNKPEDWIEKGIQ